MGTAAATGQCHVRSSVSDAECLLPAGHPADSPSRFHRYPPPAVRFAFEDLERQAFLAVNRAGDGYHYVHPAGPEDHRVTGRYLRANGDVGEPTVRVGELVCECKGARFHGSCYVLEAARERLSVDFGEAPGWNGAGASVEAARG